jgi:uncharacterized protein YbaP (TraB family)
MMVRAWLMRGLIAFVLAFVSVHASFAADKPAIAHPAFWVVEDGANRVYLLGSVHLLPPDIIWMRPDIEEARASSQVFVFEAPLKDADVTMAKFVDQHGRLPLGKTLRDVMPAKDFEQLEHASLAVQYPPKLLSSVRPWLAAVYLELYSYLKVGYSPFYGVDRVIEHDAEARRAEFAYFESVDEQLSYFLTLTPAGELGYLRSTVKDVLEQPDLPHKLIDAWASGDTKALGDLINEGMASTPQLKDRLLISRNRKWVPQVIRMLKSGKTHFVTVGAGHLIGPGSVVDLLRRKGYRVTGP